MKLQQRTVEDEYVLTLSQKEKDDLLELLHRADSIGQSEAWQDAAKRAEMFPPERGSEPPLSRFGQLARDLYCTFTMAAYQR